MIKRRKTAKEYPEQCCSIEELPEIFEDGSPHVRRTIFCFLLRIDFNNTSNNKPDFFYVCDFTSNEQVRRSLLPKRHNICGYIIEDNQVFQMDVLRWRIKVLIEEYDTKYGTNLQKNMDNVSDGTVNIVRIENQLILLKVGLVLKSYRGTLECRTIGIDLIDYYNESIQHQKYIRKLYSNLTSKLPPDYFKKLHNFVKLVIPIDYLKNIVKLELTDSFVEDVEFEDDYIPSPKDEEHDLNQNETNYHKMNNYETNQHKSINQNHQSKNDRQISINGKPISLESDDAEIMKQSLKQGAPSYPSLPGSFLIIEQLNRLKIDDNKIYFLNGYIIDSNINHVCVKSYDSHTLELQDPIIRELQLIVTQETSGLINQHNSLVIYITCGNILNFFQLDKIEQLYTQMSSFHQQLKLIQNKNVCLKLIRNKIPINDHLSIPGWTLHNQTFAKLINNNEHENNVNENNENENKENNENENENENNGNRNNGNNEI